MFVRVDQLQKGNDDRRLIATYQARGCASCQFRLCQTFDNESPSQPNEFLHHVWRDHLHLRFWASKATVAQASATRARLFGA